jgi:ABC-type glutathione transport system ATPase component
VGEAVSAEEADASCTLLCNLINQLAPLERAPCLRWHGLSVVVSRRCCTHGSASAYEVVRPTTGEVQGGGGVVALMGPSGSGKTSFLHALASHPTSGLRYGGSSELDGVPVASLPRGSLVVSPQDAVLPEELTAREAITFACALRMQAASPTEQRALVLAILDALQLSHVADGFIGGRLAGRGDTGPTPTQPGPDLSSYQPQPLAPHRCPNS